MRHAELYSAVIPLVVDNDLNDLFMLLKLNSFRFDDWFFVDGLCVEPIDGGRTLEPFEWYKQ